MVTLFLMYVGMSVDTLVFMSKLFFSSFFIIFLWYIMIYFDRLWYNMIYFSWLADQISWFDLIQLISESDQLSLLDDLVLVCWHFLTILTDRHLDMKKALYIAMVSHITHFNFYMWHCEAYYMSYYYYYI